MNYMDQAQGTSKQHLGGEASLKGYEFETLVTLFVILEESTIGCSDPFEINAVQSAKHSYVDDIHITSSRCVRRLQVKSGDHVSWTTNLRNQFEMEWKHYNHSDVRLSLELWLSSLAMQEKMERNRGQLEATIRCIPDGNIVEPYKIDLVRQHLDVIFDFVPCQLIYSTIWCQLAGVWAWKYKRKANVGELLNSISAAVGVSLRALGNDLIELLSDQLNKRIADWIFSADGYRIKFERKCFSGEINLSNISPQYINCLIENTPDTIEELFNRMEQWI